MTYARKIRCAHAGCAVDRCQFSATVFCSDRVQAAARLVVLIREHLLWHAKSNRPAVLNVARVEQVMPEYFPEVRPLVRGGA